MTILRLCLCYTEAGLSQEGLLCPAARDKTLEANGEEEKCFFFISKASNSLVKRVCILMLLQKLLSPFFVFCLIFSLPPSSRLRQLCCQTKGRFACLGLPKGLNLLHIVHIFHNAAFFAELERNNVT